MLGSSHYGPPSTPRTGRHCGATRVQLANNGYIALADVSRREAIWYHTRSLAEASVVENVAKQSVSEVKLQ